MSKSPLLIARAGLPAILALSVWLGGCGGSPESPQTAGGKAGPRVFLIALDGADWEIIDRLAAEGRLPTLSRLRSEGAWGVLRSEEPMLSPIVWTTIATGRPPTDHGIVGFLTTRDGKTEPVRSDERKVRAFWNIASEAGVRVGVIGWYASWPAEPVDGFVVSDRIGSHQVAGTAERARAGLATPDSVVDDILRVRGEVHGEIGRGSATRFFDTTGQGERTVTIDTTVLDTFVGILRTTELYRRLTPMLAGRFDPDLLAVYLEATDAAGHLFAHYAPPPVPGTDPGEARRFGQVFDRSYEMIDGVLGDLIDTVDPAVTTVMIVSDHGFKSGDRRPATPSRTAMANRAPLWHRPEGILLLWGKGVRRGHRLADATLYDVLPTVFRLLDVPLARTLPGRPVDGAFEPGILAERPRAIADYESAGPLERDRPADPAPAETIARLQALGYVGAAGGNGGTPAAVAGPDEARGGQEGVPLNLYNQGLILMNSGREDEALEIFRRLQSEQPDTGLGYLGEGLVLLRKREAGRAVTVLEKAVRVDERLGAAAHGALGEAYLQVGRLDPAREALARSLESDPSNGRISLLLAQIHFARREFDEAGKRFDAARRLAEGAKDRAAACVGLAVIAEEKRELDRAAAMYEEALGHVEDFPPALERYGNLELYRQRTARAVELLGRLAAVRPDSPQAHALHGRALAMDGKNDAAREALERSLKLDPDQSAVRAMLEQLRGRAS